jgi:drug/metabolite transporter (DMT)-like permease
MPVTAAVLLAALLHASWNALLGPVRDRLAVFALGELVVAGACVAAAPSVAPDARSWPYLAASGVLHLVYALLLMRSYGVGDFNQVYPLARGTSPLLVTLAAALLANERLRATQLGGVLAVCIGLAALAGRPRAAQREAVLLAAATGVAIASYTVLDGLGVRHAGTAIGYTIWLFAIQGLLVALAARRRLPVAAHRWRLATLVSSLSILAYGLVIWAQQRGALGPIAALRETSVIAAAVIGALAFHERLGLRRIAASVVVAAGAVLLNL